MRRDYCSPIKIAQFSYHFQFCICTLQIWSCDSQFFFQKQNDEDLLDHDFISKETCQDTWPLDICTELKTLCLYETVYAKCKKTCGTCGNTENVETLVNIFLTSTTLKSCYVSATILNLYHFFCLTHQTLSNDSQFFFFQKQILGKTSSFFNISLSLIHI